MFSYNKKVRLKPYEVIPLADFNVQPHAPPLNMSARPRKIFHSHSRADLAHGFARNKQLVAPINLRRPKSAMELSTNSSRDFESRNSYYTVDDGRDEIAESSKELIEFLPRISAIKHDESDSEKKNSLPLDTPATGNRDCMIVYPQNTVPMAKYRKKISGELPDSDDDEAPMTDAQRWSKEKLLEDTTLNPGQFRRRRKASLWADPIPDGNVAYDLHDQIKKPTYMGDDSMDSENLTAVLAKGSRRKSLLAIGSVVAKLTNRRQSNEDEEYSGDIGTVLGPRRPTVVTFDVPNEKDDVDEGSRVSESARDNTSTDDNLAEVSLALPPAQFMDTKTIISLSENLVSKITNDHRTPENALKFPLPNPAVSLAPVISLATIPENDRPLTASSKKSDGPIFIRPPETPFEKSDDITSEDDMSSASRPKRHSSRSSHQRHRTAHRNSIGGNSGDYDDTELDKERSRRQREARRRQSSKRDADEKNRIRKRKSNRKTRRRGSEVREKVGIDHLDRAKNEQQCDEPVEDNSIFKFASFLKGSESKSSNLSKSESFALENFARKIISLIQQNGDANVESNDSDAALIHTRHDSNVTEIRMNDTSDTPVQQLHSAIDTTPLISTAQRYTVQSPDVQPAVSVKKQFHLEQTHGLPPPIRPHLSVTNQSAASSTVTVLKPDVLSLPDIFEPLDGDTLKTVVRLPTLQEQPGENEEILRKRVEDFLNGNSEEGDSHFQQVPGRRWVAEWARREEVINSKISNRQTVTENVDAAGNAKKLKRIRSSLSRKRSIKRSPSTASIGTFFSRIFGRLRMDDELPVTKITEVVACVYTVRVNNSRDDLTRNISANTQLNLRPRTNNQDNITTSPTQTTKATQKVNFLDEIANSKDSGVFSDKGLDSVDENGRFYVNVRGIGLGPWNFGIAQQ